MDASQADFTTIDEYINLFPQEVQSRLQAIRQIVIEEAPEAQEAVKYAMPTFVLYGNLVHFAAFTHHIGFYPTPSGTEAFQTELTPYKRAKGSIQFPLDQPLPLPLIREIVRFRVQENLSRQEQKLKEKQQGKKKPKE